ncbi:MAG: zinc-dependent metalloprotease [Rubrivivax sp.]|nr:zinc-dependent metalloprotease [Rubrivivax sp.]
MSRLTVAAAVAVLSACATPTQPPAATPTPAPAAAPQAPAAAGVVPRAVAAGPAGAASAPAAAPAPGTPQPFATVVRDARRSDGLFTTWRKDDKVWLELKPEDFGKAWFFSPKLSRGIGEPGFYAGTMYMSFGTFGRPQLVEFRRVHNQVQLLARNTGRVAPAGSPTGRAVDVGFSPSLLGSAAVASQPHPERKTILIELNSLLLADVQGMAMRLQRTYRQNYTYDLRHSSIASVRHKPQELVIETLNHYATATLAIPQPAPPGATGPTGPQPTAPSSLPDARSLFLGVQYSLAPLPEVPMAPRRADARVGYFTTPVDDYTRDLARSPRDRHVYRWRLEKKDPAAEISEPVKPITYWIDRTVPVEYRQAIIDGILEWNKAFEKIGFRNAVVAKVQPDDADFDTLDLNAASVRWMTNAQSSFGAIGPSQVDPRSGEILDADIGFESLSSRSLRTIRSQLLAPASPAAAWARLMQAGDALREFGGPEAISAWQSELAGAACHHADFAAEQLQYALDVLDARGDLDPDSPEVQRFVYEYLKDTTMHEVGHTLGLRHNFRSSQAYSAQQLDDESFLRGGSLAGSVMEYAPIRLPKPGQPMTAPFQATLGPYDFWAIEYAYKPIAPEQERAELQRIASRSGEPQLAYGSDDDNFLGIDPQSLMFDLGSDPVAFAQRRIEIARDLLDRQARRTLSPGDDYSVLRRSIGYALRDVGRAAGVLARQIGGVRTVRDHPGTSRDPLVPVEAAAQRAALDALAKGVFAADSFALAPPLQRRLAPDYLERLDALSSGDGPVQTDYSVVAAVADMQRALLAQLMSDGVAQRILDSVGKVDRPADAFRLSELHERLTREIWSDLAGGESSSLRRELQREHVNRLANALLRPTSASRADTRSLVRAQSMGLLARLQAASKAGKGSAEQRAHLDDCIESLRQGLEAKATRAAL